MSMNSTTLYIELYSFCLCLANSSIQPTAGGGLGRMDDMYHPKTTANPAP
jgi:hypothetical protein